MPKPIPEDRTVIEVATELVDSVTHLLFSEITTGSLIVDEDETPLKVQQNRKKGNENQDSGASILKGNKSRLRMQMQLQSIDIDEHKRLVRKFISQNKSIRRKRQMRSVEISEKSIKMKEEEANQRETERNRMLEERRKSISQRLEAKKNLFKQIQKEALESNSAISNIRRKKFLYQQKQQEYYKKVILPKIEQQSKILEQKKSQLRKPINLTQLLQHEKNYQTLRINSRINRSLTISVIKTKEHEYQPPQFVPESYKRVQEEEQEKRLEEEIRRRQAEVNQIRRKEFVRKIDELRELELEMQKSKEKDRPESPKKEQAKQKAKPQLNRQQTKNVGNEYLRELLNNNRKALQLKKQKQPSSTTSPQTPSSPRQAHKTDYQIEIIKEQRIERVHKIRGRKINQIMRDKNLDEVTRHEKLKYQIEKLDGEAELKMKQGNDVETINESAMIMMNAIQAKMALLGVDAGKL